MPLLLKLSRLNVTDVPSTFEALSKLRSLRALTQPVAIKEGSKRACSKTFKSHRSCRSAFGFGDLVGRQTVNEKGSNQKHTSAIPTRRLCRHRLNNGALKAHQVAGFLVLATILASARCDFDVRR